MTKNLEEKTHKEQLEMLGTFSLEKKIDCVGNITVFKYLKGYHIVDRMAIYPHNSISYHWTVFSEG